MEQLLLPSALGPACRRSAAPASADPVTPAAAAPSRLRPLPALQCLRGVAALMVVLAHAAVTAAGYGFAADDFVVPWGDFGVDLFFVISGFIIVYSSAPLYERRGSLPVFLWRRFSRIAPLYWIVTSLYLVLLWATRSTSDVNLPYLASSYLFVPYPEPTDGAYFPLYFPGWTLQFEAFFYLCFSLVLSLRRSLAILAVSGFMVAVLTLGGLGLLPPTPDFWSTSQLLEFVAGCCIAEAFLLGWRIPAWSALLLSIASIAWVVATSYRMGAWPPLRGVVWGAPAAALIVATTLREAGAFGPLRTALAKMGDASYSLYAVHLLVLEAATQAIQAVFRHWHLLPTAAYMALMLALAVGAAFASYDFVERPLTRRLQRPAGSPADRAADRSAAAQSPV